MKRESVRVVGTTRVAFDDHGMTWPLPGKALGDLEWTLRYGVPTDSQRLDAAGVVAAYAQLVTGNDETRRLVARGIKQAMKEAK
jgi:hypothetical protein